METFPSNGCNSTHTITLDDDIAYTGVVTTMDITTGNSSGQATMTITGGTGPFTIEWDNGETGTMASDLAAGDHSVTVIDGYGCEQVFTFFIDDTTSAFEEEWKNDIKLFPNPASHVVNFNFSNSIEHFRTLELYNINGRLIQKINLTPSDSRISLDVTQWSAGIYLAKINATSASHTLRFMID